MTPVYQIRDLELSRGRGFTLRVEHLELSPESIYLLTGPNGAGKSTLLNVLALLEPPERGEVVFAGEPCPWEGPRFREQRLRVTLVHQAPYLLARSVQHNLAFGLRLRGIRGNEQQRRIGRSLAAVGLAGFEKRHAHELSGGEVRRVALARALTLEPDVLLLDEPAANLDQETADILESLVKSLPARGITVIMASHDPGQPRRLGGEVIRLVKGRVVEMPERTAKSSLEVIKCR